MPKIEVNEKLFFSLMGETCGKDRLEELLPGAKAELDAWYGEDEAPEDRSIKIELNDTNRPDLWTTAGLARQLRAQRTSVIPEYDFFVPVGANVSAAHTVKVDASVKGVRPYLAGFIARGPAIGDATLRELIQTQEKLAWNFGRKRRTVSIGLYRPGIIKWPVRYKGVDPDEVSFVPLQETRRMTLRQILAEHPKGKEYAFILKDEKTHPLLCDDDGNVLSYPPIINSADLGAVLAGDRELFVEVTGTDYPSVALSASIMACDFADMGFSIENVSVEYPYDTPFGRQVTFPCRFQEEIRAETSLVRRLLGKDLGVDETLAALTRMGIRARAEGETLIVQPPECRNDFLHPVDVVEDVMMGMGMGSFPPQHPSDFTIGRLSPIESFSRKAKATFVGMGYQEMIYNYLGSKRDYVDRMGIPAESVVRISNPMSENFEFVRNSPLPGLLCTESVSAKAVYPHRTFEAGKVAIKKADENYGIVTRQYVGFLSTHPQADYNEAASHVSTLMYYMGKEYSVKASSDPRFIEGRQAGVWAGGKLIGVFGELHPAVLDAFGVSMPSCGGEIDLDLLMNA